MEEKRTDDREMKLLDRLFTIMSFMIVGMVLLMLIAKLITGIDWFPDNDSRCALLKKPSLPMIFMGAVGYLIAWTIIRTKTVPVCRLQDPADLEKMRAFQYKLSILKFRSCAWGTLSGLILSYVI